MTRPARRTMTPSRLALLQTLSATLGCALVLAPAGAATVSCGDAMLGSRVVVVEQGLLGGLCHAQLGNLDPGFAPSGGNTTFSVQGSTLTLLAKEVTSAGDVASPLLDYFRAGQEHGGWSLDAAAWGGWDRLFLGFHFGHAGDRAASNPDSFVIELAGGALGGSWALGGGADVRLTGLSNLYLFGIAGGTPPLPPPPRTPHTAALSLPGTAGLAAAGLLLLAWRRRCGARDQPRQAPR